MSPLIILGLSITLVVLSSICLALFLSWRRKNAVNRHLEHLLEDIAEQQNSRKKLLSRQLSNKFKLSEHDSDQLGEQLVGAEKKFLQRYVAQVIQQTPSSDLYPDLTELLNTYVNSICKHPQREEPESADLPPPTVTQEPDSSPEPVPAKSSETEPEPDWGDVFD